MNGKEAEAADHLHWIKDVVDTALGQLMEAERAVERGEMILAGLLLTKARGMLANMSPKMIANREQGGGRRQECRVCGRA